MEIPIKVNLVTFSDGEAGIKNTYIFVGNVEPSVRKALESPNNEKSQKMLKSTYGSKWRTLLDLEQGKKSGGDDLEDEISIEEIAAIANINKEPEEKEIAHREILKIEDVVTNKYIYDTIYPHDTILDLKRKLSLFLKIPIYKQHIWYKYSGKIFNLNYNIYLQGKIVNLSLINAISISKNNQDENKKDNGESRYGLEYIEKIPVLINFYNVKNLLTIKAYDTFSTVEDITTSLAVNEFNLVNLDDIVSDSVKVDSTALEIIYYGLIMLFWPMFTYEAWVNYVKSPTSFEKLYPDISLNYKEYRDMYDKQLAITEESMALFKTNGSKKELNEIENALYISITNSIIQVISMYNSTVINLRNLFDSIKLNKNMVSMKCSLIYDGQKVIFNKYYKNEPPISFNTPLRCLLIKIKTSINVMELYMFPDGNYTIKARWSEESLLDFDKVFEAVSKEINPIIDQINSYHGVVNSNAKIAKMNKSNVKFTEVYLSLIYRKHIKYGVFKTLENVLHEYEDAGIVLFNEADTTNNSVQYFFLKGMSNVDSNRIEKYFELNNYYSYLTDGAIKGKWQRLYTFIRPTTFQYRNGDIKISVEGIRETEFNIFYLYVVNLFHQILYVRKVAVVDREPTKKLNVKSLKQQDPVLYDFKKLYNSNVVYSKICQKQYQPIILNDEQYNKLNKKEKDRVVKYWNFTTNSDAHYFCPNTRFPYIQFTIKKHPQDFCIPCCKKKETSESENETRKAIHQTCLTEHKYQKEKTNLIQDTRYIMNYGKYISPGRLCNLPENSLEPLLYENFSDNSVGIESECQDQSRYYIYGIEQHFADDNANLPYVGYVITLSISLEIPIRKLVDNLIKSIKKDDSKFKILLNGQIIKYFYSSKELCDEMYYAFNTPLSKSSKKNTIVQGNMYDEERQIPWNDIFIELAYYYLDVLTAVFIDISQEFDNIKLLINNQILEIGQMANSNYKLLLVIKKKQEYHPIYYVNHIVYFRTKLIGQKLFNGDDNPVKIISKLIIFNRSNKNVGSSINLSVILDFIKTTDYRITTYYINSQNHCYYLEIQKGKSGIKIYFPVEQSIYTLQKDVKLSHQPDFGYTTSIKELNYFIKAFNHWIAVESYNKGFIKEIPKMSNTIGITGGVSRDKTISKEKQNQGQIPIEQSVNPIYNYIVVDKWLLLKNPFSGKKEKVIGFLHNNVHYYHEEISPETALKLSVGKADKDSGSASGKSFLQLLYHPKETNALLAIQAKPKEDNRIKNITKDMYNYYLYELLILELTELFNKERNVSLRHKIKKIILDGIDVNTVDTINKITSVIPSDSFSNSYKKEDVKVLTEQVNNYITTHRDKKILFNQIDIYFYNFDRQVINNLKTLSQKELVSELMKIAKKVVQVVPSEKFLSKNNEEFPNVLYSCLKKDTLYCEKKKLAITEKKLKGLLEILASDILNPFKEKWIFNMIYTSNIISYFKFNKYPDETITIQLS